MIKKGDRERWLKKPIKRENISSEKKRKGKAEKGNKTDREKLKEGIKSIKNVKINVKSVRNSKNRQRSVKIVRNNEIERKKFKSVRNQMKIERNKKNVRNNKNRKN